MRTALVPALILTVMLASCTQNPEETRISEPGKTVTPRGGGDIVVASETEAELPRDSENGGAELKVRLPAEYIPSQAITANLDLDETDEQIIVFKRRDDPDDRIRLLVVTFDPIRNSWIRAWEGATAATSVRSFTVYTDDLIGDHEQEIIAFGINSNGEQTLDVFRRTSDALGLGLSFAPILSIAADVTIDIREVERSEAYEAMETISAPSYSIVAERRDHDSENQFDSLETTYYWDYGARRYVTGRVESISGDVIEDSRLRDLFAGSETDFEEFLSGPWYRSSEGGEIRIASFDPRDRAVVFHSGHLQQSFVWDSSTKTVYGRGITLYLTNESIRALRKRLHVSVQDLNRISVSIPGTDGLDGTYDRLTGSLQAAVLESESRVRLSEHELSGLYRADDGLEVVFSNPEFSHRRGDTRSNGGYVLYRIGDELVLSLKFVDDNRLPIEQRDYRVTYEETSDDERIVRRLVLEPGEVGIAGFSETGDPETVLEQIELVEDQ
ncbi:MAG: pallilysin-related adhesin [Spirochaetota bacterium]